jgi:hypothetical protein
MPTPIISETGNLPAGVNYEAGNGDGVIAGIPTVTGTFPVLLSADNGTGNVVTQSFNLVVDGLTITSTSPLPSATKGVSYTPYQLTATGGTLPLTWGHVGSLPKGIVVSKAGVISGKPTVAGTYTITIKCTDDSKKYKVKDQVATATFQLTVAP